jgi:hypothetical protein
MVTIDPSAIPSILITPRALYRLQLLVTLCPAEIAGLGYVTPHPRGLLIQDIVVLPQRVTDCDAELDPDALFGFLATFVAEGGEPAALQLWWHSHVDGEVYWSETDLQTIERFPGARVISIVGNQRGELLCRLDLFSPERERFDDLPLVLAEDAQSAGPLDLEALHREVQEEIRSKVRRHIPMELPTDHEGVVGLLSEEGYEVEIEPGVGPAPGS